MYNEQKLLRMLNIHLNSERIHCSVQMSATLQMLDWNHPPPIILVLRVILACSSTLTNRKALSPPSPAAQGHTSQPRQRTVGYTSTAEYIHVHLCIELCLASSKILTSPPPLHPARGPPPATKGGGGYTLAGR